MLQELDKMQRSKEEFMAQYKPVREAIEAFLRGGKKVKGNISESLWSVLTYAEFGRREFPYYLREASGMLQGPGTPVQVVVKTEGHLYPYSGDIKNSFIMVAVKGESDANYPVAVLPPVESFMKNEVKHGNYLDIPNRVSEILTLLTGS